jgi:glycosyltransferase domain-containing protein
MLENLTIIILTYNREHYLRRSIEFYSKYKARILIVDGSKKKLPIFDIKNLPQNFKYIYSLSDYHVRANLALNNISTKYFIFASEDDFFLPASLKNCIKKLSKNIDIISCCGIAMGFDVKKKKKILAFRLFENLKGNNLLYDDPNKRVIKHMSNFVPKHFYSVCRTSLSKNIFKKVFSYEHKFFSSFELQIETLMPYLGKTVVINELMFLRSLENEPIRGTNPSLDVNLEFGKWWSRNHKEKIFFLKKMELIFTTINNYKNYKNECEIEKYYLSYLSFLEKHKRNFLAKILSEIFQFFPEILRSYCKYFLKFIGIKVLEKKDIETLIDEIKNEGIKINLKEIEEIKKSIINFHNKK